MLGWHWLQWIDALGGDGYPFRYTATTLRPLLIVALAQCPPDEELLIEAWDES